jgi:hypothetical protein
LKDRQEEVNEFDSSTRVLAEVNENFLERVAAERVREEEQSNESGESRLVE